MHAPVGMSIGTTNFAAVRASEPPVRRRSLLTLYANRAPQLGALADAAESGLCIAGFVERVGEHEPLIAADGSAHRPELLLVNAVEAMVDAVGGADRLAIGVPAQWAPGVRQMVQQLLQTHAGLSAFDAPMVSDAVAALTALHDERGVASRGVVALLDFGGGGTSITVADAAAGFEPIAETRRYHRFSGNGIDQAILGYILGSDQGDTAAVAGTAMVGDVSRLVEECRQAKERLSLQTATELVVELPGYRTKIALTRAELEQLIRQPLDGALAALQDMLQHSRIGWDDLAAVAAVGGGAHIPLVIERLSARRRVPVVTSQRPEFAVAVGATLCAQRTGGIREATMPAMAMTMAAAAVPTDSSVGGIGVDEPGSAPPQQLAWSQEEAGGDDPVLYSGAAYDDFSTGPEPPAPRPRVRRFEETPRRYGLPQLLIGIAALVAAVGVAGVSYSVMRTSGEKVPPQPAVSTVPAAPPSPESPEPAPVAPPPSVVTTPEPTQPAPPPPVTTTQQPPTTTTTPQPTTTTTTTTSTTAPTTTTTPTTAATTTPSPSEPTTTTTVPMRTEYLTIPLVPVPIPIQVPGN